jgi:hypothetical protein
VLQDTRRARWKRAYVATPAAEMLARPQTVAARAVVDRTCFPHPFAISSGATYMFTHQTQKAGAANDDELSFS